MALELAAKRHFGSSWVSTVSRSVSSNSARQLSLSLGSKKWHERTVSKETALELLAASEAKKCTFLSEEQIQTGSTILV